MLSFSVTDTRSDGMTKTTPHTVPDPNCCCPKGVGSPTSSTFKRCSYFCRGTSALAVIGGIVSIGLIESSNQPNPVKTGVCIAAGLLILSSYYCYKFGESYILASERCIDSTLPSDNFEPV